MTAPGSSLINALGQREAERDGAVRQVAMLRHTLATWIDDESYPPVRDAYTRVLALLGPADPEVYDPEQPF